MASRQDVSSFVRQALANSAVKHGAHRTGLLPSAVHDSNIFFSYDVDGDHVEIISDGTKKDSGMGKKEQHISFIH